MVRAKKILRLIIGCDHAAFTLKETLKKFLEQSKIRVTDAGVYNRSPVDYPDIASTVASTVSSGTFKLGILICGTGIGMSMAANRFDHIRAALCNDTQTAKMSKRHNNSNILVMGARIVTNSLANSITKTWLETQFESGRHQRRLDKFDTVDNMGTFKAKRIKN